MIAQTSRGSPRTLEPVIQGSAGRVIARSLGLLILLPPLVAHLAVDLLRGLVRRKPRINSGKLYVVLPYPPGEKSGASKAMQEMLQLLERAFDVTRVPLFDMHPRAGRIRTFLSDYLTFSLPMPAHCRLFLTAPDTVLSKIDDDRPVLIEFLSGSLFLFYGRRPDGLLVLREHEPLCRRLLLDLQFARGLDRFLLRLKVVITWLMTADIYTKVDRIVALTPEDARFIRRAFPLFSRKVSDIPVTMQVATSRSPDRKPSRELLFLGNLFHRPNLDGLFWFLRNCAPHLGPGYRLHLCGLDQPLEAITLPDSPVEVIRHGFVEDLDEAVGDVAIAIAPVISGGGVRMKNLYLAAQRRAIVTTRLGNEGIGFEPGVEAIVCDDPEEMARSIRLLSSVPGYAEQLGNRAAERVRAHFGQDAILARYLTEIFTDAPKHSLVLQEAIG